ncbi:c6 zinc finger [Fusarium sporotrichioides]|uniref:C6 zinc finger n=1 Tax=Fusarium sporotrichioides TaxID=5514 RepID=A0A395RUI2_FUSSP|nr:c6 zinc finger [Fusarium sporotrichioides]
MAVTIPRALRTSKEDVAITNFYNSTVDNLPNEDPTRHLHQQLPSLYFQSQQGSVLRLAVEAISYASAANLIPQAVQLSGKLYIKALSALRTALQDPKLPFSDETLYAVLLLCGYETKMGQPSLRSAWGSHVDGAAALIKARGTSSPQSPLFHDMFSFVRKSVVLGQMQTSKPVDETFFKHTVSSYEDPEDRLVSLAARVPQLQYSCYQLDTLKDVGTTETERLISDATELDSELSIWASSVSPQWSYATAVNINNPGRTDYTPYVIHRYTDRYIARVWNFYRVSRLIIQSILLHTATCLSASTEGPLNVDQRNRIERVIMGLVDDICASVPYLLGFDLTNMSLAFHNSDGRQVHDRNTSSFNERSNMGTRIGGFSLIWPLSVASSALPVPAAQRDWMQRQLQLLTNHSEPLTSTILSGRPNEFRFDCV